MGGQIQCGTRKGAIGLSVSKRKNDVNRK
jgi:hypothetical protein